MKYGKQYTIIIAIFLFTLILLSGCSHKVMVSPERPESISNDEVPIDVGLYISNEIENYKVSEWKKGDKWNYPNLGQASATQFQLALSKAFNSVELIDSKENFIRQKNITIHALVVPSINEFNFDIPLTKFQVYPARIYYKIKVYNTNGDIIIEEMVEGVGDTKGEPGFDFEKNPSAAASKAVEDGVRKSISIIINSKKIQNLYKK